MPSTYPRPIPLVRSRWPAFLTGGLLSASLSSAALVWRGRGSAAPAHCASSLLWGGLYAWLRQRRTRPTAGNAVLDALVVGGAAALLDTALRPRRLGSGCGHRASRRDLGWACVAMAAGLALGGLKELRE